MFEYNEPFGNCIFCDDIRQEIGGKNSFMGAYYGALLVPSFPVVIPKFAVVATLYEPRELALKRTWVVPIRIFVPGNAEPIGNGEMPVPTRESIEASFTSTLPEDPDVPKTIIFQLVFFWAPMTFTEPGRVKVRAFYSDEMVIKLGSLRIESQPSPAPSAS